MERDINIKSKLQEIFVQNGIEADSFSQLEIDSLTYINLLAEIEETFSVEIPDEFFWMNKLIDLEELERCINGLISKKSKKILLNKKKGEFNK